MIDFEYWTHLASLPEINLIWSGSIIIFLEVRGQLSDVGFFLLPCVSQGSNLQVVRLGRKCALPSNSSCWPTIIFLYIVEYFLLICVYMPSMCVCACVHMLRRCAWAHLCKARCPLSCLPIPLRQSSSLNLGLMFFHLGQKPAVLRNSCFCALQSWGYQHA